MSNFIWIKIINNEQQQLKIQIIQHGMKHLFCKLFIEFQYILCIGLFSNLQKNQDELHLHVYDDDIIGRDSIGSTKINLKKHVFGKGRYDDWVKLPAHLGLGSHGEIHVIIEHHVKYYFYFHQNLNLLFFFFLFKIVIHRVK